MANEVFLGEDGIIEQVYAGKQTESGLLQAFAKVAALIEQLQREQRPANVLVDITTIGRLTTPARKKTVNALREVPYDRVAIYGSNTLTKALVNLIIYAAGKGDTVKLFKTRREAQQWLAQNATAAK